jgi:hypothetical protein
MAQQQSRDGQSVSRQSAGKDGANRPAFEARLGRIKAVAWRNLGESGPWFSVVFSRLYKDGDEWKQSESFGRDDLPLVMKLADMVHTWIYQQGQAAGDPQQ